MLTFEIVFVLRWKICAMDRETFTKFARSWKAPRVAGSRFPRATLHAVAAFFGSALRACLLSHFAIYSEGVHVISLRPLREFWSVNADAEDGLKAWQKAISMRTWAGRPEVRTT